MAVTEEARYRLRLAHGFVEEARQDVGLQRWRSCVDNSQLAVENAAKAVLALLGPVGRNPTPQACSCRAHWRRSASRRLRANRSGSWLNARGYSVQLSMLRVIMVTKPSGGRPGRSSV